jgi:uncharacterized protein YkwD
MKFPRYLLFTVLSLLFVVLLTVSGGQTNAQVQNDRTAGYEVVARLNEWRLSLGLAPFKLNETLTELAFYQADYIRTLRTIPSGPAIHVGRNGEGITERALYDQFDWPTYGRPEQIAIGEIAAVNDIEGAFAFWHSSKPHRETVINPTYREVGVAAIQRGTNTIYVVVLGSRPDVLPVLIDPRDETTLYMTRDYYRFNSGREPLLLPTEVRFFDESGRPLNNGAWTDWSDTMQLPTGAEDRIYILYTDGDQEALTEVDLARDWVILPGYIPAAQSAESFAFATPVIIPTSTPEPPRAELRIVYDDQSLAIINVAGKNISLRGITLNYDGGVTNMGFWSQQSDVPLDSFPANHCLQTWSGIVDSVPPEQPDGCRVLRSGRGSLRPEERFWLTETFEVRRQGIVLAICTPEAGRCEADYEVPLAE